MPISSGPATPQEGTTASVAYPAVSGGPAEDCVLDLQAPARRLIEAVGDKWALLCLYALDDGPVRFNALERRLVGISQKVLSQTLRKLERSGLVIRTIYPDVPPRVTYELSPLGSTLRPLLGEMCAWARIHAGNLR